MTQSSRTVLKKSIPQIYLDCCSSPLSEDNPLLSNPCSSDSSFLETPSSDSGILSLQWNHPPLKKQRLCIDKYLALADGLLLHQPVLLAHCKNFYGCEQTHFAFCDLLETYHNLIAVGPLDRLIGDHRWTPYSNQPEHFQGLWASDWSWSQNLLEDEPLLWQQWPPTVASAIYTRVSTHCLHSKRAFQLWGT